MNNVTIYSQQCNGFGWHWMLDRGGLPMSSTEAFANAGEAERVATSVAKCNDAEYKGMRKDAQTQFAAEYEAALAVGRQYEATGDVRVFA
jgi:hypothetical protein